MQVPTVIDYLKRRLPRTAARLGRGGAAQQRPVAGRLQLEALEDRCLLSFNPAVNYPVPTVVADVVVADFNGDSRSDLVVPNYAGDIVSVLRGNADGTFQAAIVNNFGGTSPGAGPVSVGVGDFNADGKLDLITVAVNDTNVNLLLGRGDGTFQPGQGVLLPGQFPPGYTESTPVAQWPLSLAVGDINSDGNLDLAVLGRTSFDQLTGYCGDYGCYSNTYYNGYVNVLLGNGTGNFVATSANLLNSWQQNSIALADFNGDAKPDVVTRTVVAPTDGPAVSVLLGNGDGTLQAPKDTGAYATSVAVGDLNADGKLDLVTGTWNSDDLSLLLGKGDGTFQPALKLAIDSQARYFPTSVAVGDINADGKLDLVVGSNKAVFRCNYSCYWEGSPDHYVHVLLGNGDATFAKASVTSLGSGNFPIPLAVADFNHDQFPDVALATIGSTPNSVTVLINAGDWSSPPALSISDATVTEGNTGTVNAVFTVSLTAASSQPITVGYASANGTATAGSDFVVTSGTLTIPAGQTTGTINVPVNGDRLGEPNESIFVNLSGATHATIARSQGVGTILDDEPRISINDVAKQESKKGQTTLFMFTVTLSAAYDQAVTMSFRTVDGTAKTSDSDYVAKSGTVTFNPGETTKTITIVVNGDSKKEANETFYLDLFGNSSNTLFTKNRGIGRILDDD